MHTSRGGAGNVISLKNTKTTPGQYATGPASLTRLDSRTPATFKSGRGGAGNVHSNSERAIFSFDEELERQMRQEREVAPVFHVGRGGAGNMIISDAYNVSRKHSDANSMGSQSSVESGADRARRSIEKGWGKLMSFAS